MKNLFAVLNLILSLSFWVSCSSNSPSPSSPSAPSLTVSDQHVQNNDWKMDFPASWWKEVPRSTAKSWETLPQDAGDHEVILSKRNDLGLLSNFAETPFVYRGVCYPTVEAYWQMMKFPEAESDVRWTWTTEWKYTRKEVSRMDGYAAKSAGGYANFLMDKNKYNWVTFEGQKIPYYSKTRGAHYDLIWNALAEKIRQNSEVLQILLMTKDLKLRPDHNVDENAPEEWHFYRLWMEIRSRIQNNNFSLETQENLSLKTCKSL